MTALLGISVPWGGMREGLTSDGGVGGGHVDPNGPPGPERAAVASGWGPKTPKNKRSRGLKGGLKPAPRERRPNLRLCKFSAASVRLFLRVCVLFCVFCPQR